MGGGFHVYVTLEGFSYTALCVDVVSRRVLGRRVMTSKTTALVTSVLEQAFFTRRYAELHFTATGLVHHSDAGSQYTSITFTEAQNHFFAGDAGCAPAADDGEAFFEGRMHVLADHGDVRTAVRRTR